MSQPSHQLFVYNLGSDADELALYMLFAPFGAVTKVSWDKDQRSLL